MNLNDFDYDLPQSYIAQTPADPRDSSKLMLLNRTSGEINHAIFRDLPDYLRPGDVLVLNNTRVIPARIPVVKAETGGKAEILLLRQLDDTRWQALVGGKRVHAKTVLQIPDTDITAQVVETLKDAERVVQFSQPINGFLPNVGQTPLPPYIQGYKGDSERYQTVYSRHEGSAAAPTAGLHFTPDLLTQIRDDGVQFAYCTLHIGLDTFQPVHAERVQDHKMHSEYASLSATDAKIINDAKLAGGRIIAVGTTSVRTLETAGILSAGGDPAAPSTVDGMCPWRPVIAFEQDTSLFIYPGFQWRVVDAMITNFHLPKSTLLMMLSAFVGRERLLHAYGVAKQHNYRFYSFGDAMFIYP